MLNVESTKDTEEQTDPDRSGYNGRDHNFDDPPDMDIENFLPDSPDDIDNDVEPEMFSKWLELDGKPVLKASAVATLSTAFSTKKKSVQTLQNMGMTLESFLNSKRHDELDPDNMDGQDFMKKGDPAAFLIRSGPKICLAVLEVLGFWFTGERVTKAIATIDDLEDIDKQIKILGQIICLSSSPKKESWNWNKCYMLTLKTTD